MKNTRNWILFCLFVTFSVLLTAHCGSLVATVFSENAPVARTHCIILDAGHGGVDGGAVSCTGIPESTYNLQITRRLNSLFQFLGYDTKSIRTEDISVYTEGATIAQKKISDLKERVRIVNQTPNALLISIHQNTFQDSQYHGAQVFYPATQGSEQLAKELQSVFQRTLNPQSNRNAKKGSGIYLLEHIQTPGILVECGFLSNPQEESNLRNADYQKKLCCIIVSTVNGFLSNT